MLQANNCVLNLPTGTVDYIRFGRGWKTLIMIPGVGDGLKTVKGMALPFAFLYRSLAREYTAYVFSRRRMLSPGMTTRAMAEDLNIAMDTLGFSSAITWKTFAFCLKRKSDHACKLLRFQHLSAAFFSNRRWHAQRGMTLRQSRLKAHLSTAVYQRLPCG